MTADQHQCGLEQSRLGELEQQGIRNYTDLVPYYQSKGYVQSFYAPSGLFTVQNTANQLPDVAFWVVDAADSTSWASSAEKLAASLSAKEIQPREKLLILVNKM